MISFLPLIAFLTFSLFVVHQNTLAQNLKNQVVLNAGVQTSIPLNSFSDHTPGFITGFGGSFTVPTWRNSPVHAGFGYGWMQLGRNAQDIIVPDLTKGTTVGEFSIKTIRHTYDVLLRFSPFRGRVQPFAEGIGGFSQFITRSQLETHYSNGEKRETSERMYNEASMNYGWGLGMQIRLFPHIFLEGKMQRIYATHTTIFNHASLEIANDGVLNYETSEEMPEFVTIQAGLTVKF